MTVEINRKLTAEEEDATYRIVVWSEPEGINIALMATPTQAMEVQGIHSIEQLLALPMTAIEAAIDRLVGYKGAHEEGALFVELISEHPLLSTERRTPDIVAGDLKMVAIEAQKVQGVAFARDLIKKAEEASSRGEFSLRIDQPHLGEIGLVKMKAYLEARGLRIAVTGKTIIVSWV